LLRRAGRIMDVADKQLDVLVMMPPAEFHAFRTKLGEASGLQSRQFRKIEVLGGLGETAGEEYAKRVEAQWPGLQAEVDMTLHRALLETVERHQVTVFDIYRNHWQHFTLFSLAEASIELDAKVLIWRQNHIKMVERMIGQRARGTGGTYGTRYLTNTTHYHFFPELWEVRNTLTAAGGGHVYSG
jgi:tryptophan 2,3-dioxygenase